MKPAPGKRLGCCRRIFQIAFHGDVAAKHDFPHGVAVVRYRLHRQGVQHAHVALQVVAHALAGIEPSTLANVQPGPAALHGTHGGRAVHLGQAVNMGQLNAQRLHALDHGRRRRSARHHRFHTSRQALLQSRRGIDQHAVHDGRGAVMGDPMLANRVKNLFGTHTAQAHVDTRTRRHRPGETPAIAVKHRQRP